MAPVSRLEINFCRLLERCEALADDRNPTNWRFKKYVQSLEDMLLDLRNINTCQPSKDTLVHYTSKVDFLKRLIAVDTQPHNSPEKALSHEQLTLKPVPDDKAKEILLKRQTKAIRDVREELLESRSSAKTTAGDNKGLRQRVPGQGAGEDFDAVLRYHNSMQEKIAEEMVSLAQNLKQNAVLAGHIVKKDTEAVQKSVQSADQNYERLQNEQRRLEEHIRRSCNCWIWLMLAIVFFVFLNMVVFMRIFPKR
ncbi:vesicle transport protein USE1-like isoform X1 [Dermacentor silvarum]|uniref:vesicle transport protein USE1-like isoform X1 n=1 Tax=Dermacentor silvarum TaxID=543639 RepID=UPI00189C52FF|nr:vesicle transport protein USE1-like isoform X1 [Dermacentor silvarum]